MGQANVGGRDRARRAAVTKVAREALLAGGASAARRSFEALSGEDQRGDAGRAIARELLGRGARIADLPTLLGIDKRTAAQLVKRQPTPPGTKGDRPDKGNRSDRSKSTAP